MRNSWWHPNSPRTLLVGAVGLVIALAEWNVAIGKQWKEAEMKQLSTTLWQTIDTLAQQIPFRRAKVERTLGIALSASDPRQFVIQPSFQPLEGGPVRLADGVVIDIDLRVRQEESHPGFLVLRVAGTCIGLDAVRAHYATLRVTDHPRGRSWDEVTSYTTVLPWGELSFSFAERNPDCLSSVAFAPNGLKPLPPRFNWDNRD